MSTNATASETSTSTDHGYATFPICSRRRWSTKPGSRVSCVGTSRQPDQGGAVVDRLRPDPGLVDVLLAAVTGSAPARSYPSFIAKCVCGVERPRRPGSHAAGRGGDP